MRPYTGPAASDLVLERVLYALSDSTRLGIVRKLACLAVASSGELAGDLPKSTVSHHFKTLREAGLIFTVNIGAVHMNRLRHVDIDSRFPGLLAAILK